MIQSLVVIVGQEQSGQRQKDGRTQTGAKLGDSCRKKMRREELSGVERWELLGSMEEADAMELGDCPAMGGGRRCPTCVTETSPGEHRRKKGK